MRGRGRGGIRGRGRGWRYGGLGEGGEAVGGMGGMEERVRSLVGVGGVVGRWVSIYAVVY